MAFIGESRRNFNSPWKSYVCLDLEDCKALSIVIGQLVARKLRTYEYYNGIKEAGDATEKQIDKLINATDELEAAESIQRHVLECIKLNK